MALSENQNKSHLHYRIFQGLLLLGYMFHHTEDWGNRPYAIFSVLCLFAFCFFAKWSQWIFNVFLGVALWRYFDLFPNLANHSNFNFYVFLILIPTQIVLARQKLPDYQNLFRCLRWLIFILYFFTFFHKLNWDFLNPYSSCASKKLDDYYKMIPLHWRGIRHAFFYYTPALGLLVEGIIPLFILFSRTRSFAIVFLVILHFTLAPMGFTDFSSLAMAFAWCFVDPRKLEFEKLQKHFHWLVTASLCLALSLAFKRFPKGREEWEILEGFCFAAIYSGFIYLYFIKNISKDSLSLPQPHWQKFMVAFLFFFGMNSYLGLRTAGNFSMFSNLRTEAERSNHILLGSNPFKFFGLQDDVVKIIDVSRKARGFYKRMPRAGQRIPKIEFSRVLDKIRQRQWRHINMTIEYQGKRVATNSAGFDEEFDIDVPWLYKKLFKFRLIQPKRPQFCHW